MGGTVGTSSLAAPRAPRRLGRRARARGGRGFTRAPAGAACSGAWYQGRTPGRTPTVLGSSGSNTLGCGPPPQSPLHEAAPRTLTAGDAELGPAGGVHGERPGHLLEAEEQSLISPGTETQTSPEEAGQQAPKGPAGQRASLPVRKRRDAVQSQSHGRHVHGVRTITATEQAGREPRTEGKPANPSAETWDERTRPQRSRREHDHDEGREGGSRRLPPRAGSLHTAPAPAGVRAVTSETTELPCWAGPLSALRTPLGSPGPRHQAT